MPEVLFNQYTVPAGRQAILDHYSIHRFVEGQAASNDITRCENRLNIASAGNLVVQKLNVRSGETPESARTSADPGSLLVAGDAVLSNRSSDNTAAGTILEVDWLFLITEFDA